MENSAQNANGRLARVGERFQHLTELRERIAEKANPLVRSFSDTISGADRFYETHAKAYETSQQALWQAHQALRENNSQKAGRFLAQAERFLDKAELYWGSYLRITTDGAGYAVRVLRPIRNAVTAAGGAGTAALALGAAPAMAGALAVSAGLHAAGMSLPYAEPGPGLKTSWHFEVDWQGSSKSSAQKEEALLNEEPRIEPLGPATPLENPAEEDQKNLAKLLAAIDAPRPVGAKSAEEEIAQAIRETKKLQPPVNPATKAKISPPLDRPVTPLTLSAQPTREELIAKAGQVLKEWKANRDRIHPPGHFLMATEILAAADRTAEDWNNYREKWQQLMERLREASGHPKMHWEHRIGRVMDKLFSGYLKNYTSGFARLIDHLDGKGGNCDDNTRLVLSALLEQEIAFPPSHAFAIQVYDDHVQPVLYDHQAKQVWDLMTNRRTSEIEGPLYDPHLFYHAYLKKEGKASPVKEEDLLLTGANVKPKSYWAKMRKRLLSFFDGEEVKTNTNLLYPKPGISFADGPSPARSQLGNPYSSYSTGLSLMVDSLETVSPGGVRMYEYIVRKFGFAFGSNYFIFATKAEAQTYQQLTTPEEQQNFLIRLGASAYAQHWGNPDLQRGILLLLHPSYALRYSFEELRSSILALAESNEHWEGFFKKLANVFLPQNIISLHPQNIFSETRAAVLGKIPAAALLFKASQELQERIENNPASFILFADRLDTKQRRVFIDWVTQNVEVVTRMFLAATLANRHLIGLKQKVPGGRPFSQWAVVEVELADPVTRTEKVPREGETAPPTARHLISAETMIEFILYSQKELRALMRWDRTLSKQFLAMNKEGAYDTLFLTAPWGRLKLARENLVPNPIYVTPPSGNPDGAAWSDYLDGLPLIPDHFLPIVEAIMERKRRRPPPPPPLTPPIFKPLW